MSARTEQYEHGTLTHAMDVAIGALLRDAYAELVEMTASAVRWLGRPSVAMITPWEAHAATGPSGFYLALKLIRTGAAAGSIPLTAGATAPPSVASCIYAALELIEALHDWHANCSQHALPTRGSVLCSRCSRGPLRGPLRR